jgi:GntR family transcriptional regulator of vanillate catabolism
LASDKQSRSDTARDALRTLILGGAFERGEKLSEPALSERLGISRTPLREAMMHLHQEGLLTREEGGSARVSSYTMRDIADAIDVRGTLEGLAARLAAERGVSTDDRAEAHRILTAIDAAVDGRHVDFRAYVTGNTAFHDWIARAAGSPVLTREITRASRLPLAGPSAFLTGQEGQRPFLRSLLIAQDQHRALVDAIEAGEGTRAEALAREHALLARRNLQTALERNDTRTGTIPGLALVARS